MRRPTGRLAVGDPRVVDFLAALPARLLAPALARRHPGAGLARLLPAPRPSCAVPSTGSRGAAGRAASSRAASSSTCRRPMWTRSSSTPGRCPRWPATATSCGSRPASAGAAADAILDALNETLADADPAVAPTQRMVTYGRDDAVTAALSAACDLRVIWGGDAAVDDDPRGTRSPPSARDLDLPGPHRPSRSSRSTGWRAADAGRPARAPPTGFVNDVVLVRPGRLRLAARPCSWVGDADAAPTAARPSSSTLLVERRRGSVGLARRRRDGGREAGRRLRRWPPTAPRERITFHGNAVTDVELDRARPRCRAAGSAPASFAFAPVERLDDLVAADRAQGPDVQPLRLPRRAARPSPRPSPGAASTGSCRSVRRFNSRGPGTASTWGASSRASSRSRPSGGSGWAGSRTSAIAPRRSSPRRTCGSPSPSPSASPCSSSASVWSSTVSSVFGRRGRSSIGSARAGDRSDRLDLHLGGGPISWRECLHADRGRVHRPRPRRPHPASPHRPRRERGGPVTRGPGRPPRRIDRPGRRPAGDPGDLIRRHDGRPGYGRRPTGRLPRHRLLLGPGA